ncbi:Hypothetical Protein FCC1311_014542 [Hondaea fermentalgiana]|uniref:DUF2254 domain-containing protein n=1 Tax=Hondaea fermentalgiana TaxID=2315210 RepID=A0A2R5G2I5_9STRA|nr:Hypothetical Protein FCC1311_014542 [Hondaea fermentalgiana]|eukprot:GBG25237.1 Hypothetical Protein FCC1311_014542 [Hondaea fermentalgiana]
MGSGVLPKWRPQLSNILHSLTTTFYLLPLISMVLNAALAALMCYASIFIDPDTAFELSPQDCHACVLIWNGSASDANDLLSMVSGACISIATLTFSLSVVALNMASTNLSPRLLDNFLKDPISKLSFAVTLSTWCYCFVTRANTIQESDHSEEFVPIIAMNVLGLHVAAVMCTFVYFIQYFVNSLRLENILVKASASAWNAVLRLRLLEESDEEMELPHVPPGAHRALADSSGYVTAFCLDKILNRALELDVIIRYSCHNGEFVTEGTLIAWVWPRDGDSEALERRINDSHPKESKKSPFEGSMKTHVADSQRAGDAKNHIARVLWKLANDGVMLSASRARENDVSLGVQQLADIATRALSPGVNDPQTAIQAMDSLSVVFSRLTISAFSRNVAKDDEGRVRLVGPVRGFPYLLSISMESIRCYGSSDASVVRRAMYFLGDIGAIAARVRRQNRADVIKEHLAQWELRAQDTFGTSSVEYSTIYEVYEHALHLIETATSARVPEDEDPKHHNDEVLEGQEEEDDENGNGRPQVYDIVPPSVPEPVAAIVDGISNLTTLV